MILKGQSYSISFLDSQLEIILRALELYSFNLHHTWSVQIDNDEEDIRNALVYHTYHEILSKYKEEYRIGYNLIEYEKHKKKVKKISA